MLRPYAPLVALVVGLTAWSPGLADDKPAVGGKDTPKAGFTGAARLLNVPGIGIDFSEDHQAGTILFDALVAGVGGTRNGLNVATTTQTVSCPLQGNADAVRVRTIVRGVAGPTAKGRVALVLHAGGKTTVVDLAAAKAKDGAARDPKKWKKREARTDQVGDLFDYEYVTEVTIPAKGIYQLTFHVLAERQVSDDAEGGLVTVDSVTFEIEK